MEVSEEFAHFLANRVLTSPRIVNELANGTHQDRFQMLVRRIVPFVVPDSVVAAASNGVRDLAKEPASHEAHVYIASALDIESTLCHRLKLLSPSNFENLLHPVVGPPRPNLRP